MADCYVHSLRMGLSLCGQFSYVQVFGGIYKSPILLRATLSSRLDMVPTCDASERSSPALGIAFQTRPRFEARPGPVTISKPLSMLDFSRYRSPVILFLILWKLFSAALVCTTEVSERKDCVYG